jgi:mRNA interferase RelE/StbE
LAYKINFKQSVSRDLKRIDKSITSEILDKIDAELSINANQYPVLKGRFAGLRKFRIGDYRIIYSIINNDNVLILRIAHRREVYRK